MTEFSMEYVDRGNVDNVVKKNQRRSRKSIIDIENGLKIDLKENKQGYFTKFKQFPYHDWDSLNY